MLYGTFEWENAFLKKYAIKIRRLGISEVETERLSGSLILRRLGYYSKTMDQALEGIREVAYPTPRFARARSMTDSTTGSLRRLCVLAKEAESSIGFTKLP